MPPHASAKRSIPPTSASAPSRERAAPPPTSAPASAPTPRDPIRGGRAPVTLSFVAFAVLAAAAAPPARAQAAGAAPAAARPVAEHPRVREALAVVETWLEAQRAYDRIPAFSAALVHDQELVWSAAEGLAHPERGEPATEETLYSICSISKLFTSIAVMQLRDRGLLDLRDPVAKHLSWFTLEQRYEGSPPIAIEGILTHSAGLPRESAHPYWTGPDFPFPTREEVIDGVDRQETLYPARKYFQYSNLGLTLAGEIVRERSGESYGDYVRRHVLEPLGMDDTYPEILDEHRGGRLATGYGALTRAGEREEVAFFQARGIAPAAGYASTARDLATFASWQFRLSGDREEVLHAHTLDEMHRVHYVDPEWETFWGLGFNVNRRKDVTFVGHGGSCPGFRSQLVLQKDRRLAVAFMANAMVNAGTYAYGVYDLVVGAVEEATKDETDLRTADARGDGRGETGPGGADAGEAGGASVAGAAPSDGPAGRDAPAGAGPTGWATLREAAQEASQEVDLAPYIGGYSSQPWGSETAVVRWKGSLALLSLPTTDPARSVERSRLAHDEGDVFYRVRSDGERGEDVVFERGADGRVSGYRVHGNLSRRIR